MVPLRLAALLMASFLRLEGEPPVSLSSENAGRFRFWEEGVGVEGGVRGFEVGVR